MNYIDLRSDTVTWPTEAMRKAMAQAPVGDDVYGDDPTVNELERLAAEMTGKEAALFVPSGTFGNQLSLFTWCPRGSEVILGEQCHIIQHEAGAASVIAGVQTRPIFAPDGILPLETIEERIRGNDIHYPPTSLICIENAHSSGRVIPLSYMKEVAQLAHAHGLPVHLDGARLFNAAVSMGVSAIEISSMVDSVMFCLSKGLCAPVGSMLAGSREFIEKARRRRKISGRRHAPGRCACSCRPHCPQGYDATPCRRSRKCALPCQPASMDSWHRGGERSARYQYGIFQASGRHRWLGARSILQGARSADQPAGAWLVPLCDALLDS
jgi:Threonine aldolase